MRKLSLSVLFTTLLLATPNPPSDLDFYKHMTTKNSVTMHWSDNSDDESGFKIFRDGELIYITKPNVTTYTDTFLYASTSYDYEVKATDDPILSDDKKKIFRQIKSVFENTKIELQYDYAENINDNRGVTAGISGFTTDTWDLGEVLRRYENVKPNNRLSKFKDSDLFEGLTEEERVKIEKGLIEAWGVEARSSPEFHDVQDKMDDELYYYPAMNEAYKKGFIHPISMLIIYDTYIQHGLDKEFIDGVKILGLNDIFEETDKKYSSEDELNYMGEFLNIREEILDDTEGWEDTNYRTKALRDILDSNNTQVNPTISMHLYYNNGSVDDFNITK